MSWYVLHLRPRSEKKVAHCCKVNHLDYRLPLRRETKVYQRRKVVVEKPVFPGYIFTSFDRDGRVSLLKTNHVVRILEPGNEQQLLDEIAQVEMALAVDPTLATSKALRKGRRVRITGGPFMGVEGTVSAVTGKTKVRLNVEMIGRAVLVEVDAQFLEVDD